MSLILPYPGKPANGDTLDASIVQANITAIAQAIQSFDASQVSPGTLTAAAFTASINPNTLLKETTAPFVASGCTWSIVSGLQGTMTSGVVYANGIRVAVGGVGSHNFTASQDTYVDVDYNGNVYYLPVANNAASPALTANAVRVAKVITNGTAISSVVQNGRDSLWNPIYPMYATQSAFNSYTQTIGTVTGGTATPAGAYYMRLGGLKLAFGVISCSLTGSNIHVSGASLPSNFFTAPIAFFPSVESVGNAAYQHVSGDGLSASSFAFYSDGGSSGSSIATSWLVLGV